jgi:hypothetical protein
MGVKEVAHTHGPTLITRPVLGLAIAAVSIVLVL